MPKLWMKSTNTGEGGKQHGTIHFCLQADIPPPRPPVISLLRQMELTKLTERDQVEAEDTPTTVLSISNRLGTQEGDEMHPPPSPPTGPLLHIHSHGRFQPVLSHTPHFA